MHAGEYGTPPATDFWNMRATRPPAPEDAGTVERVARLEATLRAIAEGDVPRTEGKKWRADGVYSKNDCCSHGVVMYEDCGNCTASFALAALSRLDGKGGGVSARLFACGSWRHQIFGVRIGSIYLSLAGPVSRPLYSERNRRSVRVLPLWRGWRLRLRGLDPLDAASKGEK